MRRHGATAARVVGWALLVIVVCAVWFHYYPAGGWITVRLTSMVPLMVIPALVAGIIFGVQRRWVGLGLVVVVSSALVWTQVPLWVGDDRPPGPEFTVITANLRLGQADPDALADLVDAVDPELLAMQEVTPAALARIRSGPIGRRLPYAFAIPVAETGGTALLSRRRLTEAAAVAGTDQRILGAVTDLPGAPGTRVLAVHPHAPLGGLLDDWRRDLEILRDHLHGLPPGPVIAAGDFNSTWDSPRFRDLLTEGYHDAAEQAGAGFLPTFPAHRGLGLPWITLDHVVLRGFGTVTIDTHDLPGSDHRAVVVSLGAS